MGTRVAWRELGCCTGPLTPSPPAALHEMGLQAQAPRGGCLVSPGQSRSLMP